MAKDGKTARGILWLIGTLWTLSLLCFAYYGVYLIGSITGLTDSAASEAVNLARVVLLVGKFLLLAGLLSAGVTALYWLCKMQENTGSLMENVRRLLTSSTQNEAMLTQVGENILLSDAIKSVAFRDKDRTVLEDAIRQDMLRERWESAQRLIGELEGRFGCKSEADELRTKLQRTRNATIEEKIDTAVKHVESLWIIHRYDEAQREVDMLMRAYPNSPKIQLLDGCTEQHRQDHKKELFARWDAAVKSNDIDQGVELLKLLDQYITPNEAAALEESARGVFRAKLHSMGVQFSLFVTEKRWDKALKVGCEIVEEFPNSRMAQEVRDKLDVLKQRAGGGN